jgi:hypothetical protein
MSRRDAKRPIVSRRAILGRGIRISIPDFNTSATLNYPGNKGRPLAFDPFGLESMWFSEPII